MSTKRRNLLAGLDRLARLVRVNLDLVVLAALLALVPPFIPAGNYLGRDDLAPWATLCISAVAFLTGGPLVHRPHPMLTPYHSGLGALLRRIGMAAVPWALLLLHDATAQSSGRSLSNWTWMHEAQPLVMALVVALAAALLLWLSRADGRTAWDPPGPKTSLYWCFGALVFVVTGLGLGRLSMLLGPLFGFSLALLIGAQFLAAGLAAGRTANLRQRLAAGRRDGRRIAIHGFRMWLAFLGPAIAFFGLWSLFRLAFGVPMSFSEAYVVPIFAAMWGAVLWPEPTPVAVGCLLHEVVPRGGSDITADSAAVGFERPPEGALRFNPLRLERCQQLHPWIVPVQGARIHTLDDPILPLWNPPHPLPGFHVLGEASFEPDPISGETQWEEITLRLGNRQDTMILQSEDAQARRVVILRPFPPRRGRRRTATYRWEEDVAEESIQVLDATTELATLRNGDVLVISAEGVARAFEVEIGAPMFSSVRVGLERMPQIEDYVELK